MFASLNKFRRGIRSTQHEGPQPVAPTPQRLLLVSHSTQIGGAETALLNLVWHLREIGYQLTVLFPADRGPLIAKTEALGCRSLTVPMPWMLPDTANACLALARTNFGSLTGLLRDVSIDAVISNTVVVFHGALLAMQLGVPHLWYAHELIDDSPELRPRGITPAIYRRWLREMSDHILCCSNAVREALRSKTAEPGRCSVLPPFAELPNAGYPRPTATGRDPVNLYVTGVLSERKNPTFAVEVLKALLFRNCDARLHFIGHRDAEVERAVRKLAERRGVGERAVFYGYTPDPYAKFAGRCVTLVCASCEPFGLTIPESLARGIPVASTRAAGPDTLVDGDRLYETGDLRRCVEIIEEIVAAYPRSQTKALRNYDRLRPGFDPSYQQSILKKALVQAADDYRPKQIPEEFFGRKFIDAVTLAALPRKTVCANIALARGIDCGEVGREIAEEKAAPGVATIRDCRTYNVIPFHHSAQMNMLYRQGRGVAIDLAATLNEPGQLAMGAFIILRLLCERDAAGTPPTVLVLGDGIGRDSARIAVAGFPVVYSDYEDSLTSAIAARNFASLRAAAPHAAAIRIAQRHNIRETFAAVVLLEVLEHVEDPLSFLRDVAALTRPNGIVLISECFDGVVDRWPTHLASNERFAGTLPLLAGCAGLTLEDYALRPFGKPFVFRKLASECGLRTAGVLLDRRLMRELAARQARIL